MVRFDADVTDPPALSTSSPVNTLKGWAGYIVIIAMVFLAFNIASNTVQPVLGSIVNMIPGINASDGGGGVSVEIAGDL